MTILYVIAILCAIVLAPAVFFRSWRVIDRRRAARLTTLPVLAALVGCDAGGLLEVDGGEGGGATTSSIVTDGGGGATTSTTTSTTVADTCATLTCPAPQVCGGGCATDGTQGCYTPGGSLDAGHWDCPSCFPMFDDNDKACGTAAGRPYAYACQDGAQPLQGCVWSSTAPWYQCCPPGPDGGQP